MRVRIEHVGLANAFRIVAQGELETEGKFIVVEPMFPNGVFEGTFVHYQPSLSRPKLELHDGATFAWPSRGFTPPRVRTQLFEVRKTNTRKNKTSDSKVVWQSRADQVAGNEKDHFSIECDIEITVDDATAIEVVNVDILGSVTELTQT